MFPEDSTSLRRRFPALVAQPEVTYLDSASTTQKPDLVIAAVSGYLSDGTANAGRGSYPWANRVTREVERVRERVAAFVGAQGADEIVFTAGATASLHAVALSWGLAGLHDGDEVLYNPRDHAANVEPWRRLQHVLARRGTAIRLVPYALTVTGEADIADIGALASPRARLITTSHVHNVYGSLTTLEELDLPVLRCFDCSQSAGHIPIDVTALKADFAAFSAHKMFGAPGLGVLYVNRRMHTGLEPFLPGGGTTDKMPGLLEGGTANLTGIFALGAALDFIDDIGIEVIAEHDRLLTRQLIDRLQQIQGIRLLPGVAAGSCAVGYGIVSFTVDGVDPGDIGFIAAQRGIYLRTGAHCLADGGENAVRVSTHIYTGTHEVDRFADLIAQIAKEAPLP